MSKKMGFAVSATRLPPGHKSSFTDYSFPGGGVIRVIDRGTLEDALARTEPDVVKSIARIRRDAALVK